MNQDQLGRRRLYEWVRKKSKPRWWWPWGRRKAPVQKQRYLVLSATAAIKKLHTGLDFRFGNNCLYYPGSSRAAIMEDNDQLWKWMKDAGIRPIVFVLFRQQIEEAEKQGRVLWKQPGCAKSMSDLSTFLAGHGYKHFGKKYLDVPYTHENVLPLLGDTDIAAIF